MTANHDGYESAMRDVFQVLETAGCFGSTAGPAVKIALERLREANLAARGLADEAPESMQDMMVRNAREGHRRFQVSTKAFDQARALLEIPSPVAVTTTPGAPLRVGVTGWERLDPGEEKVHSFHLILRARPVSIAIVGGELLGATVETGGVLDTLAPQFAGHITMVESGTAQRRDYDLPDCPFMDAPVIRFRIRSTMERAHAIGLVLAFELADPTPPAKDVSP